MPLLLWQHQMQGFGRMHWNFTFYCTNSTHRNTPPIHKLYFIIKAVIYYNSVKNVPFIYRQGGNQTLTVDEQSPTKLRREASPLGRREASACGKTLNERFFFFEEKFEQWRYNIKSFLQRHLYFHNKFLLK